MCKDILEFIGTSREQIDRIIDLVPIPIFIKDVDGRYVDCNLAFQELFSVTREDFVGKTVFELWSAEEASVFFSKDRELFERGGLQIYESTITSSVGIEHIVQFHKRTFNDSNGVVSGFLGAIFDITKNKRLEKALFTQASTDELTGLLNRREGMAQLELLHQESVRKNRSYCLAIADLDHFKKLNDEHGHLNGDFVLWDFSQLIKSALRSGDICFRYGGEEFVILLPNTRLDDGIAVLERLRRACAVRPLCLTGGHTVYTTLSMGLIQHPTGQMEIKDLLQACDDALYAAKAAGRNRIVCAPREGQATGI